MKLMKKIATLLVCVCLVTAGLSFTSFAATDGKISFNDPTVEVGKEVVVTVTTKVDAGVANLKFTVKYDPAKLEFVSAPNTTKVEDGKLEYDYAINQNSLLRGYDVGITFRALSEGSTRVDITSYDISSSFDIAWTVGYSQVTIGDGETTSQDDPVDEPMEEPTDEPTEDPVDDPTEEPADDPVDEPTEEPMDEPAGDSSAQIDISSSTKITLLSDVTGIELPERYLPTTVSMSGVEYPAWQDSEEPDMYILYAQNHLGNSSLYRYDNFENTYQRISVPKVEPQTGAVSLLEGLGDNAEYVVWGAAALIVILIIVVIVLGVKLYNRDAELDEVYDDLDAALAEKEALKKAGYVKEQAKAVVQEELPVVVPEDIEETITVDDIVFETEDEDDSEVEVEFYVEEKEDSEAEEEDDSEVEVEFYVEEAQEEVVVDEPAAKETVVEEPVAETVQEVKETVEPAVEQIVKEEFYDDDDSDYSGLPGGFFIDFIDLDD